MKRKLLAVLITAIFTAPAAYAQGTTAPKDTTKAPAATGSASTSAKGDAMKSDKGTAASAKGQAKADAKKGDGKSPDAIITGKIKTGFIKDKIVRSRNYNVDTKDGVVTVKGKARTQAELDRALEIAKSTEGVKSVNNQVQLMASTDKQASAKRDTRAAASTSPREPNDPVAKGDAKKAGDMSASTKGSTSASASKQGSSPDALITTKIKAEYAKDRAVSATNIKVDTNNGVVTLSGTAKSKAEADKAVQLARNIKDVKSVRNDIKVESK